MSNIIWLWILFGVLMALAVSGGIAFIILQKKQKRNTDANKDVTGEEKKKDNTNNSEETSDKKKKRKRRIIISIIFPIILIILLFLLRSCSPHIKESSSTLIDMDTIEREFSMEGIPMYDFSLNAEMFITDGPGTPEGVTDSSIKPNTLEKPNIPSYKSYTGKLQSSTEEINEELSRLSRKYSPNPYTGKLQSSADEIMQSERYLGVNRDAILNISNIIKITNPKAGTVLEAGQDFVLTWDTKSSIINNETMRISVLFSSDGGANYKVIADAMNNVTEYKFIVPDSVSNNCILRIQVNKIGKEEIYAGVNSDTFSIIASKVEINDIKNIINIKNPKAGTILETGTEFVLLWDTNKIENSEIDKVSILFSSNGGTSYQVISDWMDNRTEYKLIVPDAVSKNCVFRIQVSKIGEANIFGGVNSEVFTITHGEAPEPIPEPEPPKYVEGSGTFISSQFGDDVRWIKLEHTLENVDSIVWQISKTPFPNNIDSPFDVPGLLVSGTLPGNTNEFKIDFAAIIKGVEEGKPPANNRGADFVVAPDAVQLNQYSYWLSVRALLLDDAGNVIGATKSGKFVLYGEPIFVHASDVMNINPNPYIKTTNEMNQADLTKNKEIPDEGFALFAGYDNNKRVFSLEKIPECYKTVRVEFQISTIPFSTKNTSDYGHPPGLVHRSTNNWR